MKLIPRLLVAAGLVAGAFAAQAATVVMETDSLTGNVEISGFRDMTPNTYTISMRGLDGSLTLRNLPAGNYEVSVSGTGSFTGFAGPNGTIGGSLLSPLSLFTGALMNGGLEIPEYTFDFSSTVPIVQLSPADRPLNFSTSYDGQTTQAILDAINAASPGPDFVDPSGSGSLEITGALFTDGFEFSVTETADWFGGAGFGGLFLALDQAGGGGNGIIDGPFSLTNVRVTAHQVPEPTSLALAGLALAGLGLARRRRA